MADFHPDEQFRILIAKFGEQPKTVLRKHFLATGNQNKLKRCRFAHFRRQNDWVSRREPQWKVPQTPSERTT